MQNIPDPYTGVAKVLSALHGFSPKIQQLAIKVAFVLGLASIAALTILGVVYINHMK